MKERVSEDHVWCSRSETAGRDGGDQRAKPSRTSKPQNSTTKDARKRMVVEIDEVFGVEDEEIMRPQGEGQPHLRMNIETWWMKLQNLASVRAIGTLGSR